MRKMIIKNTSPDPLYDLTELVKSLEAEGGVGSFNIMQVPGTKDLMVVYSNSAGV